MSEFTSSLILISLVNPIEFIHL